MISGLLSKTVLPLAFVAILILAFYPICTQNGQCDYFLLWIMVGWPFGIGKMFVWIVPKNFGLGGTLGVFALNVIIGGLIGGLVAMVKVIFALVNLILLISQALLKLRLFHFRTRCPKV